MESVLNFISSNLFTNILLIILIIFLLVQNYVVSKGVQIISEQLKLVTEFLYTMSLQNASENNRKKEILNDQFKMLERKQFAKKMGLEK